jgi:hypothetical protein
LGVGVCMGSGACKPLSLSLALNTKNQTITQSPTHQALGTPLFGKLFKHVFNKDLIARNGTWVTGACGLPFSARLVLRVCVCARVVSPYACTWCSRLVSSCVCVYVFLHTLGVYINHLHTHTHMRTTHVTLAARTHCLPPSPPPYFLPSTHPHTHTYIYTHLHVQTRHHLFRRRRVRLPGADCGSARLPVRPQRLRPLPAS